MDGFRKALEIAGYVPDGEAWHPLKGGRTNRLWRVGHRVVKCYADTVNPLFSNEPDAEWTALAGLHHLGLAPTPLARDEHQGTRYIIYSYRDGALWRAGPNQPAKLLRRVHDASFSGHLSDAPDGSAEIVGQTKAILKLLRDEARARIAARQPVGEIPPSGQRCLLHGDPVPANIITGTVPILVDWQCPAKGDPVEDLCLFLSPAMQLAYRGRPLQADEAAQFIAAYGCPKTAARLAALAPWHHWRMAAYCAWKTECDPIYAEGLELELAALSRS